MARAVLMVMTNPVEASRDAEFNEWYDTVHLRDVLAVPGFVAASRYRISEAQVTPAGADAHRYLAIYEVESEDLGGATAALMAAAGDGGMEISETLDMGSFSVALYEEITARRTV